MANKEIKKVAVLGAGVMGSGIAAHLAGCGVDVLLLDCLPAKALGKDLKIRNALSLMALERIKSSRPSLIYSKKDISRIQIGNFEDDLSKITECDWVIEAVVERADIKQKLFGRIENILGEDAIVSSNTSGLGWSALAEGRSQKFRRWFLITHFFNPPRYLKLIEFVTGADTDKELAHQLARFCEERLGKGIVHAKDTPNFIANRIGAFHLLDVMHLAYEKGWPIEAVDGVLGPAVGRPKSAVFRTADIVGLDTLSFVALTSFQRCKDEMAGRTALPQYIAKMIAEHKLGQKTGEGFYKKDPQTRQILAIDPKNLSYRPVIKFHTPSLAKSSMTEEPKERLNLVVWSDDQAGEIAWTAISRMMVYTAMRVPEISDDIVSIDRAMRWGFNWQMGPFETWDALGIKKVCGRLSKEGRAVPQIVNQLLSSGREEFYSVKSRQKFYFDVSSGGDKPEPGSFLILKNFHDGPSLVEKNSSACLMDLGDGIFVCEFKSKMNTIDTDIIALINKGIDHVQREGVGLLLANEGENFSVGANLMMVLAVLEQGKMEALNNIIVDFQALVQKIRFSPKPVMAAPFNMTLGGGAELCLAVPKRCASVESYMGLVEAGVGLIPAGGGCKNLLLQLEALIKKMRKPADKIWSSSDDAGPHPKVRWAFENIAMAKVSGSAKEAVELGYLTADDTIVLDRETLLLKAKLDLIQFAKTYQPPAKREDITLPGRGGRQALVNAVREFRRQGRITEYDALIAEKLAHVLSGGDMPAAHVTTEDHILELEREAFLSLCGMEKTRERIRHMLKTGKPLRN